MVGYGQSTGAVHAVEGVGAMSYDTLQFLGMRGEDAIGGQVCEPLAMVSQVVQGIGIEHHWCRLLCDVIMYRCGCVTGLSESGTDAYGLIVGGL